MDVLRKSLYKAAWSLVVVFSIVIGPFLPAKAEKVHLNGEEQDYIAEGKIIKAASIEGGAPLHYRDSEGNIKGIAVNVLEEIASMTGLRIEYQLYDSISEAISGGDAVDILFGVTREYAPPYVVLSNPYLESETILYYNSLLDPNQLDNKRFAAIEGGTLPEGIKEENTIYFNNREDAIGAVETGKADYGFGNAYSLAFYTLQNGYKNIVTIPTGIEKRAYCIGLIREDPILLSIINKSIEAIDHSRMQTLILDVASQVEKRITIAMLVEAYGVWIVSIILLALAILASSVFTSVRAKNLYKMENRKYKLLSHISNECMFEYIRNSGTLEISDQFIRIIDMQKNGKGAADLLIKTLGVLDSCASGENVSTIRLPLVSGGMGVFKIVCSNVYDEKRKPHSVIGKLIDITDETMEKERLITKSQLDGLTGLYNISAVEKLITRSIENRKKNKRDALIIIDCDNFKNINDTLGHLKGNLALKSISKGLRFTFRQTDILGRIGGDEFCVYMHNIPSAEYVWLKCRQLSDLVGELNRDYLIKLSIGIAILDEENTYHGLFKQADDALYLAKGKGGAQIIVHNKNGRSE